MTVWLAVFGAIAWFERDGIGSAVTTGLRNLTARWRSEP